MKKAFIYLVAVAFIAAMTVSCTTTNPDPQQEDPVEDPEEPQIDPKDLSPFTLSVPITQNWIYSGKPSFTIHVENPNKVAVMAGAKVVIVTDKRAAVTTVIDSVKIPANGKKDIVLTTDEDLAPGFYRATCSVNGKGARTSFVFGVDPDKLVSAPDKQADFDDYWATAKDQLAKVDMNATLTEITFRSSAAEKVYLVEMQSVPDGVTGEPVVIHGYYVEPQDEKKHPVIVHFFGYDDQSPKGKLDCPSGGNTADYAEFYLSTRGQMINNRKADQRVTDGKGDFVNTYGDWFAFHFGQKDSYYYRGAFMDCVQAVRFMATRSTSDMDNLFAEGSSQGGAFSYAAAALSDHPFSAIAPCVAFLGDFPDYFDIVSWPGEVAKSNKGSMSNDEMYAFLSYFDTKNLATRIKCPVIACSGLQDGTCPPHTNRAPFNNLTNTDKEMYYYPEMGHEIPADWPGKYMNFFKARIK